MCIDTNGETVYTIGFSCLGCCVATGSASIYYAYDDNGNYGFFWSVTDYSESAGLGLLGASLSITSSVLWDANTIDDLEQDYINIGGSIGEAVGVGLDMITLDDSDIPSGISVSAGLAAGIDWVHTYSATNHTIWKSNQNSLNTSSTKSTNSSVKKNTKANKSSTSTTKKQTQCRACGRPIGNQYAWQCSSPSYY